MDYWTHPEDHDSETRGDPWGFASFCAHWATLQDVFGDVSKSPSTLVAEFKWLSRLNEKRSCALLQVAASECAEYAEWPKRPCGCNLSKALLRSEVDMIIAGGGVSLWLWTKGNGMSPIREHHPFVLIVRIPYVRLKVYHWPHGCQLVLPPPLAVVMSSSDSFSLVPWLHPHVFPWPHNQISPMSFLELGTPKPMRFLTKKYHNDLKVWKRSKISPKLAPKLAKHIKHISENSRILVVPGVAWDLWWFMICLIR